MPITGSAFFAVFWGFCGSDAVPDTVSSLHDVVESASRARNRESAVAGSGPSDNRGLLAPFTGPTVIFLFTAGALSVTMQPSLTTQQRPMRGSISHTDE
jgi:hypothetical protein